MKLDLWAFIIKRHKQSMMILCLWHLARVEAVRPAHGQLNTLHAMCRYIMYDTVRFTSSGRNGTELQGLRDEGSALVPFDNKDTEREMDQRFSESHVKGSSAKKNTRSS